MNDLRHACGSTMSASRGRRLLRFTPHGLLRPFRPLLHRLVHGDSWMARKNFAAFASLREIYSLVLTIATATRSFPQRRKAQSPKSKVALLRNASLSLISIHPLH